ncbi:Uncharacterized protein AB751O23_AC_00240 [Chlamydiales bacterium SCGC AB-751-O23]|jgi:CRP/FNR family transcriptional regulator, cyclic AMP receptor protein|nr:Uncharacterized protein AB751O23_AC_00240 [Chlamydiales bacterium SCGC AB-751-O23]
MSEEMPLIEKALLLKKTRIFSQLDLDLLVNIADKAEFQSFKENHAIFSFQQDATRLFIIIDGRVKLTFPDHKKELTLKCADHFGDLSLFSETKRSYQALCLEDVQVLTLTKPDFLRIVSEFASVAFSLLTEYAQTIEG